MARIAEDLRAQLTVIDTWLAPAVANNCGKVDAAKLRVLAGNLADIADRVQIAEGGIPEDGTLAQSIGHLSDIYAGPGTAVITASEIEELRGIFEDWRAWAWALEVALRTPAALTPADLRILKIAAVLDRQGVQVAGQAMEAAR